MDEFGCSKVIQSELLIQANICRQIQFWGNSNYRITICYVV
jgi:hypothetical protein